LLAEGGERSEPAEASDFSGRWSSTPSACGGLQAVDHVWFSLLNDEFN
jgi:hypothetical protein